MKRHFWMVFIIVMNLCLSGCYNPRNLSEDRYAVCKELNRQIVLNGATTNPRTADIERAERGRLVQAYDANNCSGSW